VSSSELDWSQIRMLERDLAAFRDENRRLVEQHLALEEQFNLLEQRLTEFETEAYLQEQIEHRDRLNQRQFATLFDASPIPLILTNHHADILMLNQKACEFFADEREALVGKCMRKFLKKESSYALLKYLVQPGTITKTLHPEMVFSLKNDTLFTMTLAKLNDLAQFSECFIMSPQVISLQTMSNQSLRLAASIIDQVREGLMVTDEKGVIVKVNHAFCEITGFTEAEVIGKTPNILHSGRHAPGFYNEMWREIQHHGWWAGEVWNRRKNGEVFPEWLQISRIHDQRLARSFYVATFSDITERKKHQSQLDRLAFYDALTGLPNRSLLAQFLDAQLARLDPERPGLLAVLFLDLDKFKEINDHYGHAEGDFILREATQRIMARIRETDLASRIGGDEFIIVLGRLRDHEDAEQVAKDLLESLSLPFHSKKSVHRLSGSIGLAFAPEHGLTAEDLMRRADAAMYRAKSLGRNAYQVFDVQDESKVVETNRMLKLLWQAVEKPQQHIQMHYQPIFDAQCRIMPRHYEALIRLVDDQGVVIYPDSFIPIAEQNGVIGHLGLALFEVVCKDIRGAELAEDVRVAVNLSPIQFANVGLIENLRLLAHKYELSLNRFHFEVTETATMQNIHFMSEVLQTLKAFGATIMLDDFGTGYASLSMLKNLPVDVLKIDRGFVNELTNSTETQTLVKAMVAMAKALELKIVVEGVETEEQYLWLQQQRVDYFQGYWLGRPKASFLSTE